MRADLGRLVRFNEQRSPDQEIARERGWRDYRVIKSFIYSDRCRRRQLLDHFGDRDGGRAAGPLLRRLRPRRLAARPGDDRGPPRRGARAGSRRPAGELSAADAPLFEALKAWRLRGRRRQARLHGRPQPHPGGDRRDAAGRRGGLAAISGIGPSFIAKYAAAGRSRDRRRALGASAQGDPGDDLPHDPLGGQRR